MKRVGIVGTGKIARHHALQWQKLPVTLAGYYDQDKRAAQEFSHLFGGTAFDTLDRLLEHTDIIDICTPAFVRRPIIEQVAAAGLPIVCEKPLARHLAECQVIIETCEAARVPLFVAHVVRFFPQYVRAKACLDEGLIGQPGVLRAVRAGVFPGLVDDRPRPHFNDYRLSGGVVLDMAIHDIDYMRWCCGEVERVFARGLTFVQPAKDQPPLMRDHALITLRFVSGAIGHIEASWAHPPGNFHTRIEIAGDAGLLEWDSNERDPVHAELFDAAANPDSGRAMRGAVATEDEPYYAELAHFLVCLETGDQFRVTPGDAYMAVKIALASLESMRTGQPVDIHSFQEPAPSQATKLGAST